MKALYPNLALNYWKLKLAWKSNTHQITPKTLLNKSITRIKQTETN